MLTIQPCICTMPIMCIFWLMLQCIKLADWKPQPYSGEIRLVGGTTMSEGHVEIYFNGKWGRVCSDNVNDDAANVICRQLGYTSAVSYTPRYIIVLYCTYIFR